jgi:hypothetical protein
VSTTRKLDEEARQLAEAAARLIAKAEEVGLADTPDQLGIPLHAIRLLARAHVELRDAFRTLHDLVDHTDPTNPITITLGKLGLERRPQDWTSGKPRLVRETTKTEGWSTDQLVALYCRVMREIEGVLVKYESCVVRQWDGMDGCWTDCTGEVGLDEALRHWAEKTDGGAHHVAFAEIDYYRIFPGGMKMLWDGSEGKEMHR